MKQITIDDFKKVDIRVGRILRVEDFLNARKPAYKLWIDFGDVGVKKSSAQITELYKMGDLLGTLVLGVVNFPPLQIADFSSEALVLGVLSEDNEVVLVRPDKEVPLGKKVF